MGVGVRVCVSCIAADLLHSQHTRTPHKHNKRTATSCSAGTSRRSRRGRSVRLSEGARAVQGGRGVGASKACMRMRVGRARGQRDRRGGGAAEKAVSVVVRAVSRLVCDFKRLVVAAAGAACRSDVCICVLSLGCDESCKRRRGNICVLIDLKEVNKRHDQEERRNKSPIESSGIALLLFGLRFCTSRGFVLGRKTL